MSAPGSRLGGSAPRTAAAGCFRWAVCSEKWHPEGGEHGSEFRFLLSLIAEEEERNLVMKYVFLPDKKRALISRLLCRRAAAEVLDLASYEALEIPRTKGKKPFLKSPRPQQRGLENFNFNVSHEGDWVVLASEPLCVCGVDVAAPPTARQSSNIDIWRDFADQLTAEEWRSVREQAATEDQSVPEGLRGYDAFQRRWSAKEAFVKARGDGIAFPLNRAGFQFHATGGSADASTASLTLDGKVETRWSFFQHSLGDRHWVTVARGPTDAVVDEIGAFSRTLTRPSREMSDAEWQLALHRESPPFRIVPVSFLVPRDALAAYEAAGGHVEPTQDDIQEEYTQEDATAEPTDSIQSGGGGSGAGGPWRLGIPCAAVLVVMLALVCNRLQ